jgi:hypothetical protein
MKLPGPTALARLAAVALFTAAMALGWDIWWHQAIGRESFFIPPHVLLHVSVVAAVLTGFAGWYGTSDPAWRGFATVLLLIPLSAPFDELWHRAFGVETTLSPLIIWSPPHVALDFAIVMSCIMLLRILRHDKNADAARFLGAILLAIIIGGPLFMTMPVQPLGGFDLIGFWGVGTVAFCLVGGLMLAEKWLGGFAPATLTAGASVVLGSVGYGENAPGAAVSHYIHIPNWLITFSILGLAAFLDLSRRVPHWLRGCIGGIFYAAILYGFSNPFLAEGFRYSSKELWIAVLSGAVGGLIAGVLVSGLDYYRKRYMVPLRWIR